MKATAPKLHETSLDLRDVADARLRPGDLVAEIKRLRQLRDEATSLQEAGEFCVQLEELIGGRPPTRGGSNHAAPKSRQIAEVKARRP